jgi:hypothetical protein
MRFGKAIRKNKRFVASLVALLLALILVLSLALPFLPVW